MADFQLKSRQFRLEREQTWVELEVLLDRVERSGVGALSAEDLHRLPALYRGVLSSLSVARTTNTYASKSLEVASFTASASTTS